MDAVDKQIVLSLMRNARTPQRRIAQEVGISAQALNYRIARLKETGVIKRIALRVSQIFYGKISGFAAFKNDGYESDSIVSRFKCLEEITIYEFAADGAQDLEQSIREAEEILGPPVMKYIPERKEFQMRIGDVDRRILEELRKNPTLPVSDLAKNISSPVNLVRKRLGLLEKNRAIAVIAEIDLSKIDSLLYSVISRNLSALLQSAPGQTIFVISDKNNGILVCYSDNLKNARNSIMKMKETDPEAEIMVVYDYEFRR